jgi:hypothetical protein
MSFFQKLFKDHSADFLVLSVILVIAMIVGVSLYAQKGSSSVKNPPTVVNDVKLTVPATASPSASPSVSPVPKKSVKPKTSSPKPSVQPSPISLFRPCTQADWDSCPWPKTAAEADAYRACIKPKCDSTFSFQEQHPTEVQELPPDIKEAYDKEMQQQ